MQKSENDPNYGEAIVSISGGNRGVNLLLIGEKTQIIRIFKMALKKSPALREILTGVKSGDLSEKEYNDNQQNL